MGPIQVTNQLPQLYDALLDWSTGYEVKNRKFKLEELSGQYEKNKKFLATLKSEPAKYHRMMANVYVEAKWVFL